MVVVVQVILAYADGQMVQDGQIIIGIVLQVDYGQFIIGIKMMNGVHILQLEI